MDVDEEPHPNKKHRTQGPNDIEVELSDDEVPVLRGPDKGKPGFLLSFDSASSSAPSELSQAVTLGRYDTRDDIETRNKLTRERLRAELS